MAQEQDKKLDHNYDGIEEYDNQLPRWWLGTFYITLIFGVAYWFYYHTTHMGPDMYEQLEIAKKDHAALVAEIEAKQPKMDAARIYSFIKDEAAMSEAKEAFAKNCAVCHGEKAEGNVGPNLTDSFWIHGGQPEQILKTINNGVVEKGMLAWKGVLSKELIGKLTGYVISLEGSNPENAKAPQGAKFERTQPQE